MSRGNAQGISSFVAATLLSQSTIEAIAPSSADLDTLSILVDDVISSSGSGSLETPPITRVPQRRTLFTDELVPAHIILKVPFVAEHIFKAWISRLSIKLDAYAVGVQPRSEPSRHSRQPAPAQNVKEVIDSCVVDTGNDPMVAVGTGTIEDVGSSTKQELDLTKRFIYILWKEELHISRSRLRNRDLSIYFSATCSLQPRSSGSTDEILKTGQTSSPNLFAALAHDPSFHGQAPVLTVARLSKHTPAGFLDQDSARPIKNSNRALMTIAPCISTNLRCTKLGGSPNTAKMLADIDIESSVALQPAKVDINSVEIIFTDGKAMPIAPVKLPHHSSAGDCTSFVYELVPSSNARKKSVMIDPSRTTARQHGLTFRLTAVVQEPTASPDEATPRRISTQWRTTVDLASLEQPPSTATSAAPSHIPTSKKSKRTTIANAPVASVAAHGTSLMLTVAFTAPDDSVRTGSTTTWMLQLSNRSGPLLGHLSHLQPARPRTLHLRLVPLLDAGDPTALLPLTPAIDVPRMAPGASATVALRLRVPALAGACRFVGVRVEDLDAMSAAEAVDRAFKGHTAVEVPGWMAPDILAINGDDKEE